MLRSLRPPIFYRYVLNEIFSPFWVTLFVFTGALFLARSLKLIDLVVNKNVPITDILLLFSYIIPRFLEIAVPMALLLSVMLAFGRLSHDSELVVIRATGMSLKQLSLPVIGFSVFCIFFSLIMGFWITPWANHRLGLGIFEIAKMQASTGLIPGVFNEIGQLTIYAENIDSKTGRLKNVLIADRREENSDRNFIARHGQIISDDKARTLNLELYHGSISEGSGLNYNMTYYEINSITLPHSELLEDNLSRDGKKSSEMYIEELTHALHSLSSKHSPLEEEDFKQKASYTVEFHKRLVVPMACLFVAIITMGLGIQPSRGGKSWSSAANVVVGILVILGYFLLFAVATAFGRQGVGPIALIMWSPNIVVGALAVFMFQRMGSEKWMKLSESLGQFFGKVFSKLGIARSETKEGGETDCTCD